jgi:protein involved in polysaccharide export with SLBB domain
MDAHQPSSPADTRHWVNRIAPTLPTLVACCMLWCLDVDGVRAQGADASTPSTSLTPPTPSNPPSKAQPDEAEYVLGPLDKVRLKVFAWRPSRDEVYEWKALNDVYTVGASGQVSLPLIGNLLAGGRTLRELCQAVSDGLKEKLGLVESPSATAEIAEFRPFYILGAVQRPGEYSYRPGLTIIQALSLAGGLLRLNELDAIRLDRDSISTAGERHVIESEINSLVAKRARLEAESTGASSVEFPLVLTRSPRRDALEPLLMEEENIFNAHRGAFEARLRALERVKSVLQKDIQSIEETLAAQDPFLLVAKQEFKQFDELFAKKLTTINRVAESARNVMLVQGERLRVESGLTRARQDVGRIEMELLDLRSQRANQAIVELRATQARVDELRRRYATAERLLRESPVTSPRLVSTDDRTGNRRVNYTIVRLRVGTPPIEMMATDTTLVQPGDTIKVELPASDDLAPTSSADNGISAQKTALRGREPQRPGKSRSAPN